MTALDRRGQSDVVGDVLLVGIVVVFSVFAMLMTLTILDDTDTTELAALGSTVSHENVTFTHVAGRTLDANETTVVFRQDGSEWRIPLTAFEWTVGESDGKFYTGERLRHPHGAEPGPLTVLVINERANSLVYQAELVVPGPGKGKRV